MASKVERAPRDQILYEDLVSMMKEQAEQIQELEHNLEQMRGTGDRSRKESRHRDRYRDDPHHYGTQRDDARQSSRGNA